LIVEHLSKDDIRRLLAAAKAHSTRDWLMILVGFWHGLRATEVLEIKAKHVQDNHLTVARLKGSLKTTQPLIASPEPEFDEASGLLIYLKNLHPNERLFPIGRQQFWRIVQHHAAAAGIPKRLAHPHILKHSIAMQTIHSAGIENVRQYLGHKSLASTGAYLKVDDETAAKAVGAASGVSEKL
jgi:type 1 fimbriae regulatory protein FimB